MPQVCQTILTISFLVSASFASAADAVQPGPSEFGLGLNLAGVTDWSSEIVFVDVFARLAPGSVRRKESRGGRAVRSISTTRAT